MYLQRKSNLFQSLQFQIDIEFRRRRSSPRLQIDRKMSRAFYKDDRTRAIKQAVAESKARSTRIRIRRESIQISHDTKTNDARHHRHLDLHELSGFCKRDFTTAPLQDQVNKRREFIVSVHLYTHWMHDRWHETHRSGIEFFLLSSTERSLFEMRITSATLPLQNFNSGQNTKIFKVEC